MAHRRRLPYAEADGRHPKRLAGDAASEIEVEDGLDSRYALRDGRFERITRTAAGVRFSILVLEREEAPDGSAVSTRFAVAHWDASSGWLVRTDAYEDRYVAEAGVLLPAARRAATATDDGLVVRELRLADHEVLAAPAGRARLRALRRIGLLAALLAALLAPPALAAPAAERTPLLPATVKDATGERITVTDTRRVVVLNGDIAEIVFALGQGNRVVGTDLSATFPAGGPCSASATSAP
jgi:hypothetical protein